MESQKILDEIEIFLKTEKILYKISYSPTVYEILEPTITFVIRGLTYEVFIQKTDNIETHLIIKRLSISKQYEYLNYHINYEPSKMVEIINEVKMIVKKETIKNVFREENLYYIKYLLDKYEHTYKSIPNIDNTKIKKVLMREFNIKTNEELEIEILDLVDFILSNDKKKIFVRMENREKNIEFNVSEII